MDEGVNAIMNDVRYAALTALETAGEATATELAGVLGARRQNTAMVLLRARRDGLVCLHRRSLRHRLSDRGHDRLAWLRERAP
jgi:DNA-binding MarR family transcriptional regulator